MTLRVTAEWRRVFDSDVTGLPGSTIDEATLSDISIRVGHKILTSAEERETGTRRNGATLSAHRLAEWLVWHWWRLRWEPTYADGLREGWSEAHDLAGIGGGWLWPNIVVHTDGILISFIATPSSPTPTEPLRYTADDVSTMSAAEFEDGVDQFVGEILSHLDIRIPGGTDLHSMWQELKVERRDPVLSSYRKIEACMGFDPDDAEPEAIERLLSDGDALGTSAVAEIAADRPASAADLRKEARSAGFDANPDDGAPRLVEPEQNDPGLVPAWQIGVDAARRLRCREGLGDGPVSDRRLAELYGVEAQAVKRSSRRARLAFALDEGDTSHLALRSGWPTGRRFELARLLADRMLIDDGEPLRPATRSHTYRQKMQRAFAGEFLCPIDSLTDYLNNDYSDETREDAANRFRVSPLAVTTLLVNNGLIGRNGMAYRHFPMT